GYGTRYWTFDDPAHSAVCVWDAATGRELHRLAGHRQRVTAVAFRPDGHVLASADGTWFFRAPQPKGPGDVRLWDAETGEFIRSLAGHRAGVAGLAWDAAGERLACAGWDGVAVAYDGTTGAERLRVAADRDWLRAVAFSPDRRLLVTGGSDGS